MCVQNTFDPNAISEDCLYLNIFTPKTSGANATLVPVFLWIHGGGFTVGSANSVGSAEGIVRQVVSKGIVVVTINYRLGALGYLNLYSPGEGNYGLKDQVQALMFVHKYINVFGGDPNKITIGGGSAGSGSVSLLALLPESSGLFTKAVMQSGSAAYSDIKAATAWSRKSPLSAAEKQIDPSYVLANKLGCMDMTSTQLSGINTANLTEILSKNTFLSKYIARRLGITNSLTTLDCIRQKPLQTIQQALRSPDIQAVPGSMVQFAPIWTLGSNFAADRERLIPTSKVKHYLLGDVSDEWGFMTYSDFPEPANPPKSEQALRDEIAKVFASDGLQKVLAEYEYVDSALRDVPSPVDPQWYTNQIIKMQTAHVFHAPLYEEAGEYLAAKTKTVYLYDFGYVPDGALPSNNEWKGAVHGSDKSFVFGLKDPKDYSPMDKALSPAYITEEDRKMESLMATMWSNFVKTGVPSMAGVPVWVALDAAQGNYMALDGPQPVMKQNYYEKSVYFFNTLLPNSQKQAQQMCMKMDNML